MEAKHPKVPHCPSGQGKVWPRARPGQGQGQGQLWREHGYCQVRGIHCNTPVKLSGSSLTGQKILPSKEGATSEEEEAAAGVEDLGRVAPQGAGLCLGGPSGHPGVWTGSGTLTGSHCSSATSICSSACSQGRLSSLQFGGGTLTLNKKRNEAACLSYYKSWHHCLRPWLCGWYASRVSEGPGCVLTAPIRPRALLPLRLRSAPCKCDTRVKNLSGSASAEHLPSVPEHLST